MSKYDLNKTAVYCTEKWMFEEVLKWHERQGNTWASEDKPMKNLHCFNECKNSICIELGNMFTRSIAEIYLKSGYIILSFDQFKQQFMNEQESTDERLITVSFSTAKEWYKQGGDLREVALKAYKEEELKEKEVLTWDDYLKYVSTFGFKTEKQRKSIEAYEKLLLLRDVYNGGCKADWNSANGKHCIQNANNKIQIEIMYNHYTFLCFKDENIVIKFLANNEQLLKDFFMID